MGNEVGRDGNQEYNRFFQDFTPLRKEYIKIIGKGVEIFRPRAPRLPEESILFIEYQFQQGGMAPGQGQSEIDRLKNMLEIRKRLNSKHIASLVWVNFKEQNSMCASAVTSQLAFEHSEMNLARYITEAKQTRSSLVKMNQLYVPGPKLASFMSQIAQALAGYRAHGIVHGFICPEAILMYNVLSDRPLYKLIDVPMLGHFPNSYERMRTEFDFHAPLDPFLLDSYSKNAIAMYDEPKDIWALGITTLCYALNDDFSRYYDWTKKAMRRDQIDRAIATLYENSLDPQIIDTIKMTLNFDQGARIDSMGILNRLQGRF